MEANAEQTLLQVAVCRQPRRVVHLVKGGLRQWRLPRLFLRQSGQRDVTQRAATLDQIQQLTIGRVMYAPIIDLRALNAVGPRVTKDTITDVWMSPFPSYEDMEVKD